MSTHHGDTKPYIEQLQLAPHQEDIPDILRSYDAEGMRELERSLVRKIDLRSLPILIILFLLNILDRNAIANARLAGLEKSLHLKDVEYQTAVMVLWAGYISMMVPSNMLLSIFKPRLYLPTVVIIWGIVSGSTGFVHNFAGLVVLRLLVGLTEAPYFPGCIFFLSSWYTKSELPSRISIFYSGYTLSSAFGGLIAAGITGNMEGVGGYAAWRWIFIIESVATIVIALLGYLLLPNYPHNTPWLSEAESALAQYRLSRENDGEIDEVTESVFIGLRQCVTDVKVWLLVLILTATVVSMSFTYFFPSIVQTLGYGNILTLILTAPPYFFACIYSITVSWHSGRTNELCFHIILGCALSATGQIVSMSTHNTGARYFAMFLQTSGSFSIFQLILSWISATIPRPKVKRAVALAMCTAISNSTNICTSYMFPSSDAPLYRTACTVITVCLFVCGCASLSLRFILKKKNRAYESSSNSVGFRYVL